MVTVASDQSNDAPPDAQDKKTELEAKRKILADKEIERSKYLETVPGANS